MRRAILLTAAGLEKRHGHFLQPPYSFAALADNTTPPAYNAQVLRGFRALRPCCQRPGLARQLRQEPHCQHLDSEEAQTFMFAWALATTASLSDTERRHAVNRRLNLSAGGRGSDAPVGCAGGQP